MAKRYFHIVDFVVFGATIVISIAIGIYYAFSGSRQRTTSEYLVGGRTMSFIPVAISLMVSFESSIMMLGLPAEAYVYGIQYTISTLGYFVSNLLGIFIVVPLFHPLKVTSAYEYLELRFQSRWVRLVGTLMGMLSYTWYMGIVLFGPAVALEAVTGFPMWSSIFVIELVAVIYTTFGGLKAVIWTDVFQAAVMFAGIFSILIKGTIDAGGPKAVWDKAYEGGRLNFFDFDPDPRTRHTFWGLTFGCIIRGFGLGFNQSTVQRISSTKSQNEAKRMLMIVVPAFTVSLMMASYEGTVAYSYYATKRCDPFESDELTDPNQIIPYMVMDIFEHLPGMPGLFLASLFSASLSTLSSGLSSLSALLWADVVHPLVGDKISEFKATIIAKVSVFIFGGLACGVAILVSQIGGTLTQIAGSLISAVGGPLTGIFFLGCFCPRANAKGTIVGGLVGLAFGSWLSIGMNFSPAIKKTPWLPPTSMDNCPANLLSNLTDTWLSNHTVAYSNHSVAYSNHSTISPIMASVVAATIKPVIEPEGYEKIYTISYLWISGLCTIITLIVGVLVSVLTGMNRPGDVDPRYLISVSHSLLVFLPGPVKRFLSSLGPQYMKEEYKAKFQDPAANRLDVLDLELDIQPINDEKVQAGDEYDEKSPQIVADKMSPPRYSRHSDTGPNSTVNPQYEVRPPTDSPLPNGSFNLVVNESSDTQLLVPAYDSAPEYVSVPDNVPAPDVPAPNYVPALSEDPALNEESALTQVLINDEQKGHK